MRTTFQEELAQLEADLQEEGQLVLRALRGAMTALQTRDAELADDVIADALKEDPLSPEPFTAADYRKVVDRLRLYFIDDVRGFQRMVDVVVSRLPRR